MGWDERWQEGNTPWDEGTPSPELLARLEAGDFPPGRALVPGCGAGYDVFAFARAGFEAVGIDIARTVRPRFERLREDAGLGSSQASLWVGDFFEFQARPFDVVFDYTFFCALPPKERGRWAEKMATLVASTGELVTLMFPVVAGRPVDQGPPYTVFPETYEEVLGARFDRKELVRVERSHPSRLGKEWLARWTLR